VGAPATIAGDDAVVGLEAAVGLLVALRDTDDCDEQFGIKHLVDDSIVSNADPVRAIGEFYFFAALWPGVAFESVNR